MLANGASVEREGILSLMCPAACKSLVLVLVLSGAAPAQTGQLNLAGANPAIRFGKPASDELPWHCEIVLNQSTATLDSSCDISTAEVSQLRASVTQLSAELVELKAKYMEMQLIQQHVLRTIDVITMPPSTPPNLPLTTPTTPAMRPALDACIQARTVEPPSRPAVRA